MSIATRLIRSSTLVLALVAAVPASAATFYVDNIRGDDAFDGSASEPVDVASGPVRSINRALQLTNGADTIVVANTGLPYYESLSLVGSRHSGSEGIPLTIVSNGAVLSGATAIPLGGWKRVEGDLWKLTPWRKGHYLLLLDGQPASSYPLPEGVRALPKIPVGLWAAWRGSIYYQAQPGRFPEESPFTLAARSVGLTLYDVHDVLIHGFTFQHYRLDGINAHDLCRGIVLEQVLLRQNARAGLFVAGTSQVLLRNSQVAENLTHQIGIAEFGLAQVEDSQVSEPPELID